MIAANKLTVLLSGFALALTVPKLQKELTVKKTLIIHVRLGEKSANADSLCWQLLTE